MKKHHYFILILLLALSLLLNSLFGRYISAKISTLPILNRWNLINPQTPIVINTREVVRDVDNEDLQNAINKVKNRISSVILVDQNKVEVTGNAINISEDGVFASISDAFAEANGDYRVKLASGEVVNISNLYFDPGSKLVFFKASTKNLPVLSYGKSKELVPGQEIFSAVSAENPLSLKIQIGVVRFAQKDYSGSYDASTPSATFDASGFTNLRNAEIFFNYSGDVVGLWDTRTIISSDNLKIATDSFFQNQKILRNDYSFTYKYVPNYQASLLNIPSGYRVEGVLDGPAKKAGLLTGDTILKVDSTQVTSDTSLEEIFLSNKPGNPIRLTVNRAGKELEISLTPTPF